MSRRFLIDENITPALVEIGKERGIFVQHVAHIGMASAHDFEVVAHAVRNDMICVTNDRSDYLRLYAKQDVHPGLAIVMRNVRGERQMELFEVLLDYLSGANVDLMNKVIEIAEDGSIQTYDWPSATDAPTR